MSRTIHTGAPSDRASTYVSIWLFLLSFISLFSLIGAEEYDIISILNKIAAFICFGIFIFQYNNKMRELMIDEKAKAVSSAPKEEAEQETH